MAAPNFALLICMHEIWLKTMFCSVCNGECEDPDAFVDYLGKQAVSLEYTAGLNTRINAV